MSSCKVSKKRCLLGVTLEIITTSYIRKLRNGMFNRDNVFKSLPLYTINKNEGAKFKLIEAEYYLQFVGHHDDEEENEYLFVGFEYFDPFLNEEVSNAGENEVFDGIDFEKAFSVFEPTRTGDLRIPDMNYLVFDLTYTYSYDPWTGDYDSDMDIELIGYLDNNLILQKYERT